MDTKYFVLKRDTEAKYTDGEFILIDNTMKGFPFGKSAQVVRDALTKSEDLITNYGLSTDSKIIHKPDKGLMENSINKPDLLDYMFIQICTNAGIPRNLFRDRLRAEIVQNNSPKLVSTKRYYIDNMDFVLGSEYVDKNIAELFITHDPVNGRIFFDIMNKNRENILSTEVDIDAIQSGLIAIGNELRKLNLVTRAKSVNNNSNHSMNKALILMQEIGFTPDLDRLDERFAVTYPIATPFFNEVSMSMRLVGNELDIDVFSREPKVKIPSNLNSRYKDLFKLHYYYTGHCIKDSFKIPYNTLLNRKDAESEGSKFFTVTRGGLNTQYFESIYKLPLYVNALLDSTYEARGMSTNEAAALTVDKIVLIRSFAETLGKTKELEEYISNTTRKFLRDINSSVNTQYREVYEKFNNTLRNINKNRGIFNKISGNDIIRYAIYNGYANTKIDSGKLFENIARNNVTILDEFEVFVREYKDIEKIL